MTDGLFDAPEYCPSCGRERVLGLCAWCSARVDAALVMVRDAIRDPEWTHRADYWIEDVAEPGSIVTADDLIDSVGLPTGSENQIGARFRTWARRGLIRSVGYSTSRRDTNHGRVLRQWQVVA